MDNNKTTHFSALQICYYSHLLTLKNKMGRGFGTSGNYKGQRGIFTLKGKTLQDALKQLTSAQRKKLGL